LIIGVVSSLALGDWNDVRIAGMNLFDALDFLTAKIMLPVAGMFVAIFVSWKLDQKKVREEVTNWGTLRAPYYPLLIFLLRYLTPIGILLVFVNELGWL
jgi:NSS family neurotransmitter:Na+ symporter